jgi:uncharacterized membrane protein YfcA
MWDHIFIASIFALSSFTFGFAGFGFSLIAVPLLALALPLKEAIAIQIPLMTALSVYNAWHYGRATSFRGLWLFFTCAFVSVPLGLFALNQWPESLMKKGLAVFIVASLAAGQLKWVKINRAKLASSRLWEAFMGVLSGWFQGAYSTGGPPAVIYITGAADEPLKAKAFLGIYFAVLNILMTTPAYVASGLLTTEILIKSLLYSPVVIVFAALGMLLFSRVSSQGYRHGVSALLVLTAVMLWLRS